MTEPSPIALTDGEWANSIKALARQTIHYGPIKSPQWGDGARSEAAYRTIWLSRTLPVAEFADLLAVHRSDLGSLGAYRAPREAYRARTVAVLLALRHAAETNRLSFFGPSTEPLLRVTNSNGGLGIQGLGDVTVDAGLAVDWLLSMPDFRHLVPALLAGSAARAALEPAASLLTPGEVEPAGPKAKKARRVMERLYPDGVPSKDDLSDVDLFKAVGDALGDKSGAISKDTVLRAAGRDPRNRKS